MSPRMSLCGLIVFAVGITAQVTGHAQAALTPPDAPTAGHTPPELPTTDVAIPLNKVQGLFIMQRALRPEKDAQGNDTGRMQAICAVNNYTPYALSSVTVRLDLYGNGAGGPNTLVLSQDFVSSLLYLGPDGKTSLRLPPGSYNHAYCQMFKPELMPGQDISGGYWITLLSARGTPYAMPVGMPLADQLKLAVEEGDLAAATHLCKSNPALASAGVDSAGRCLLGYAAIARHASLAQCLLDYGAAVNGPTGTKEAPLITGVNWGSPTVVDVLLARHADVTLLDKHGVSALEYAQQRADADGAGPDQMHILHALQQALATSNVKSSEKSRRKPIHAKS